MNDPIENWLADVALYIENVMGHTRYDHIEEFVEAVTMQVSQQVKDNLLGDGQDWHEVARNTKESGSLLGALFVRSRVAAEINA